MATLELAGDLLHLHVIDVDAVDGQRFAEVQRLAGVKGVVGEHDAGRQLEQVDVGRRLVQAVPSGEWGARLDQGEARVAEAVRVGGVGLVTFAQVGVAAGALGALSLAGERHVAFGG